MTKRTALQDIKELEQLNELDRVVIDKRNDKRANAKKERRNRHYSKAIIKHQLNNLKNKVQDESG